MYIPYFKTNRFFICQSWVIFCIKIDPWVFKGISFSFTFPMSSKVFRFVLGWRPWTKRATSPQVVATCRVVIVYRRVQVYLPAGHFYRSRLCLPAPWTLCSFPSSSPFLSHLVTNRRVLAPVMVIAPRNREGRKRPFNYGRPFAEGKQEKIHTWDMIYSGISFLFVWTKTYTCIDYFIIFLACCPRSSQFGRVIIS